jgi:hypothetical protein
MARTQRGSQYRELKARLREMFIADVGLKPAQATRLAKRCIELVIEGDAHPQKAAASPRAKRASAPSPAFDPFHFGAVVVLMKEGRSQLEARLGAITSREDLLSLAHAQHLPVEPELSRIEDVRNAIVESAERRIARRRMAAC